MDWSAGVDRELLTNIGASRPIHLKQMARGLGVRLPPRWVFNATPEEVAPAKHTQIRERGAVHNVVRCNSMLYSYACGGQRDGQRHDVDRSTVHRQTDSDPGWFIQSNCQRTLWRDAARWLRQGDRQNQMGVWWAPAGKGSDAARCTVSLLWRWATSESAVNMTMCRRDAWMNRVCGCVKET